LFENIQVIPRLEYSIDAHDGKYSEASNREEEKLAMDIYNQGSFDLIGKILNYQIPLKRTLKDTGVGKIDLLAYEESKNMVRIFELKRKQSRETMLRCICEAYTYSKIIDRNNLCSSFSDLKGKKLQFQACPLVFRSGAQHTELLAGRPKLEALMEAWNVTPYYIDMIDGNMTITDH